MQHAPGFLRLVDAARARIRECTVADVKRRLDAGERFHLIDVREQDEWARGHLPQAQHLSKGIIDATSRHSRS
jgi:rhodanese-related sulfurtransferase